MSRYSGYCPHESDMEKQAREDARYHHKDRDLYERRSWEPCKEVYTKEYDRERDRIEREQHERRQEEERQEQEQRERERHQRQIAEEDYYEQQRQGESERAEYERAMVEQQGQEPSEADKETK